MNDKGFVLIAILVAIVLLGGLALAGRGNFSSTSTTENNNVSSIEDSQDIEIKNNILSVEIVIMGYLIQNSDLPNESVPLNEINNYIDEELVHGKDGLINNHLSGWYFNVKEIEGVKTNLPGIFIANNDGEVYYLDI